MLHKVNGFDKNYWQFLAVSGGGCVVLKPKLRQQWQRRQDKH